MPSRAETRGVTETILRLVSVGILVWMLWLSLDRGHTEAVVTARTSTLSAGLRDWSRSGTAPDNIAVGLDSVPTPLQRDWLAALQGSGSKVSWSGTLPAVGIEIQPVASPSGGYNVLVSAPRGSSVVIGDQIGPVDTVKAGEGGARVMVPAASGTVTATSAGTTARASLPESPTMRRILVIGSAGWESKFVVAALEEDGWKVDAQSRIAPGVSVTQGSIGPIDTARYAAVIALDRSAAAYGAAITRYVANGGGAIIAGPAGSLESFSSLRAGTARNIESPSALSSEPGSVTLQSLSIVPLAGLKSDAVVLDRKSGTVTVTARRYNGGRVIQTGYLDTWRWRMSGGDNAVAEHRRWWTNAVAGVAYAPGASVGIKRRDDNAPVAGLAGSLGGASAKQQTSLSSTAGSVPLWLLFAILSGSLLAEWVSRRTRGAR